MSARLERCPECAGRWPNGPEYALRGGGWLRGLARSVTPTNFDVAFHDYHYGGRFLLLETKGAREEWPPQKGQLWLLSAIAASPKWTVRILRGDTRRLDCYRVSDKGVDDGVIQTYAEAVRRAVDAWLRGATWRDAESLLAPPEGGPERGHICGWARLDGVWTCVGDHYASGLAGQEATACGATLPQYP